MGFEIDPAQSREIRVSHDETSGPVRLRVFVDSDQIMKYMVYYLDGTAHPQFLSLPMLCPDGERTLDILYGMALSKPIDEEGNRVLSDGDPHEYQRRFLDTYSPPDQSIEFFRRRTNISRIDLYEDRDD